MKHLSVLGFLVLLATATPFLATDATPDAFRGKSREQVEALLGRPSRSKPTKGGGETLVYRLFRVEGVSTDPDLILVELPGVGSVGRRLTETDAFEGREVSVEPSGVDEYGRPVGGGLNTTESRSIQWNKKDGKQARPERPPESATLHRIKLTLELDAAGSVVDWSVDPKERARD